jgi:hypothetical protein
MPSTLTRHLTTIVSHAKGNVDKSIVRSTTLVEALLHSIVLESPDSDPTSTAAENVTTFCAHS